MLKIKNENGITLIVLVVTIIVLMILASITVNLGVDSLDSTKDRKLQAELEIVQQACISEYTKAKELDYLEDATAVPPANFIGAEVAVADLPPVSEGWAMTTEPSESYKKYFRVTPDDFRKIDVLNVSSTYIINYYTGEVYNETVKKSSEGNDLYIKSVTTHQTYTPDDPNKFNDW